MDLLREAVRQNASWCSLVCRAHGVGATGDGRVWRTDGPPPPYFPAAMTLAPDVTADEVVAAVADVPAPGVKDSFARVDLAAAGFEVLFDATWVGLAGPVRTGAAVARVAPDPEDLGPDVVVLEAVRDGAVVGTGRGHRSGGVIGLSDVTAPEDADLGDAFAALVHATRERFGDELPVVGYERGAELEAAAAQGFSQLGPLRVWVRRTQSDG